MSFLTDNLLAILVTTLVLLIYVALKKRWNYFKDRGIPVVEQSWLDLIKSLRLTDFTDTPCKIYKELSDKMEFVGYHQAAILPCILVMDPLVVQEVFIKEFSHFQDHGFDQDLENNPLNMHLFNLKGDQWRALRHKMVPVFTSGKLRGMVPLIEECADGLIQDIENDSSLRQDVNLKDLFKKYTLSVIVTCAFGIDPDGVKDPECEFRRILNRTMNPTLKDKMTLYTMLVLPKVTSTLKLKFFPQEVEDFFMKLIQDVFEMRMSSGVKRNDFIQLLLELKEKGSVQVDTNDLEDDEKETIGTIQHQSLSTKLEMTDELLMAQAFIFIIGGFDNSGYLCAITSYALSKHPDVQERVRKEVREMRDKHGAIDYNALRDMKLLGACIDEALRMYAPLSVLVRECTRAYTFKNGTRIDKGTRLLVPAHALHMDSKYWPNPEQFKPERFLTTDKVLPGTYLPFGDGPRICIAQRLALIVGKLIVAKVLDRYEILPSHKTKEPVKTRIVISADFVGGIWGNLKPLATNL